MFKLTCVSVPSIIRISDLSIEKDVCVFGDGFDPGFHDVRFLTKEKLLALTPDGHIELYDIEDLSEAPQLKARFMLPIVYPERFHYPSVFHSASACAHLNAPDDNWIWTTNPADRVISVMTSPVTNLVISARIFFMDIPPTWFDVTSLNGRSVPWSSWGLQNSRHFSQKVPAFGVGGSRVIWAVPISGSSSNNPLFQLHMADFNPSAVAGGIGKVVRDGEPISFDSQHPGYMRRDDQQVTTYLPFVEVVNDRIFNATVHDILLHEKSVLIFTTKPGTQYVSVFPHVELMTRMLTISSIRHRQILRYSTCSHTALSSVSEDVLERMSPNLR
jgi:hypothetical protein